MRGCWCGNENLEQRAALMKLATIAPYAVLVNQETLRARLKATYNL